MKTLSYAALAAALAFAAPALAQAPKPGATTASPPTTTPSGSSTSTPSAKATTGASASTTDAASAGAAGTNASVTTGMSVKDNTGALIGEVTDVKADASGKSVATIKMGTNTFSVDAANLAVADGAATVNASQADIAKMIKK
jgi:hypothetical protein